LEDKISQLTNLWFDISLISENVIVIYAVPKIFVIYPVDLTKLLNYVLYLKNITYDNILDWIFATKACKTSIKAWYRLSMQQMMNLIKDWFENIEGMFVCQHWRTFFVQVEKKNIDKMFDR
jgi:DNA mismatch repair ATPase MutL